MFRGQKKKKIQRSQVRFPFLSLNLSKTMNLFWSGEFCSGGKKKKENPAKPGAVPFLVFEPVETKFRRLIDELPPKRAKKWRAKPLMSICTGAASLISLP